MKWPSSNLPAAFVFGVQGFTYNSPIPTSVTFNTDGTAVVSDQYGRPIEDLVTKTVAQGKDVTVSHLSHQEVVKRLVEQKVDWQALSCAGWPQLPYAELKKLKAVPPTPEEELRKIKDRPLRLDALKMRREADAEMRKEMEAAAAE